MLLLVPLSAGQRWPPEPPVSALTDALTSVTDGQRVLLVYDQPWMPAVLDAQTQLHAVAASLETRLFAGATAERQHLAADQSPTDVCVLLLGLPTWDGMPSHRPPHTLWTRVCTRLVVVLPPEQVDEVTDLVEHQFSFTSRPLLLLLAADGTAPAWRSLVTDCARRQARPGPWQTVANFTSQPRSLRNVELRVTSTAAAATPFAWLRDGKEVGVEVDLLDTIATNDGFSVRFVRPNDSSGLFGKIVNGSWTGVIGMLDRDLADLAIGDISDTLARRQAVDYVYPFHVEHIGFISHKPLPLPRWVVIVRPFDTLTWILLFISLVIAMFVFAFLPDVFSGSRSTHNRSAPTPQRLAGRLQTHLPRAAVLSVRTLLGQSSESTPRGDTARMVLGLWWFFCMVIGISYQTVLVSQLSKPAVAPAVNSLQDLARSALSVACSPNSAVWSYISRFADSNDASMASIAEKLVPYRFRDIHTVKMRRDTVYMNEFTQLRLAKTNRPDGERLHLATASFFSTGLAFPIRPQACYADRLSKSVLRLLQAGLVEKWIQDAVAQHRRERREKEQVQAMTLHDMQSAFFCLALGHAAALVALAAEMFGKMLCRSGTLLCR
ncbi:glutamate receptor-like [Amphibalanus amphitrite]|uniref:glutamate receptor-like n=1 Tax=Amphibalanus amphitrite TaxID=1232801 RepID=UPI001C929077|nr:glutamate receptor-like [Amphibalanus amphitrite]